MIRILAFPDFHDRDRIDKFLAFAAKLGAKLPLGPEPLYSYRGGSALPEALNEGELIYLSDIVFHAAVAWSGPELLEPNLPEISAYTSWSQFLSNPIFRVFSPRFPRGRAASERDRPIYLLQSAEVDQDAEHGETPRRTENGVNEYCYPSWAECSLNLYGERTQVLSHAPLSISPAVHAALCLEDMRLENLARIPGSFGVYGFHHMDDDFLVSVRGEFWAHWEEGILIL